MIRFQRHYVTSHKNCPSGGEQAQKFSLDRISSAFNEIQGAVFASGGWRFLLFQAKTLEVQPDHFRLDKEVLTHPWDLT